MGLETLKTIGLESKRYAVRERMSPFVGEEPSRVRDMPGGRYWIRTNDLCDVDAAL